MSLKIVEKADRNMKKDLIKVGIAGSPETDTGQRTSTLIEQIDRISSMNVVSVYNRDIREAVVMLEESNVLEEFVEITKRYKRLPKALFKEPPEAPSSNANKDGRKNFLNSGIKIYTDDLEMFLTREDLDVIVVSEMDTENATFIIWNALLKGKSVVNLNAVSEATLGLLFKNISRTNNAIYSVGAGDEPASTLDLINFCDKLGLEIICAGKGKNNPLNIYSTPDDYIAKPGQDGFEKTGTKNWKKNCKDKDKREYDQSGNTDKLTRSNDKKATRGLNVSPRCITSFVDGTKTMLEMCILSNAAGIPIDKPGMHGPKANVEDLVNTFNLKTHGGILENVPAIDYAIGDIAPGVFVVFTCKQKSIIEELRYLKMGNGPNFVIYKPYHLGNIEVPLSIYDVIEKKTPTLTVKDKIITSVGARAKKNLKAGDIIDSIGGYTFSGLAISYEEIAKKGYVPICLVENAKVIKDIEKGEIITFDHIKCDAKSTVYNLWNLQLKII